MELLSWLQPRLVLWLRSSSSDWQLSCVAALLVLFFSLLAGSLQRASNRLPVPQRPMPSALAWLVLVPLLGLFWSWGFSEGVTRAWAQTATVSPSTGTLPCARWIVLARKRLIGQAVCTVLPLSLLALPLLHGFSLLLIGIPLLFLALFSGLFFLCFWMAHLWAIWRLGGCDAMPSDQMAAPVKPAIG